MAKYSISSDDFALVAATAKTAIRINAASGRKVRIVEIRINDALAGSTDQGIKYRIMTGGTDGTGASFTPVPLDASSTAVSTAKVAYTAEPTGSPVEVFVDGLPAGSKVIERFSPDEAFLVAGSGAIYLELTAAQARASGVVSASVTFEEI